MKMKILLLSIILVGLLLLGVFCVTIPYHFYSTAITEGIDSSYIKINRKIDCFYKGREIQVRAMGKKELLNQSLWKTFHFHNYTVPLPVHHPQLILIPYIKQGNEKPYIGAIFQDRRRADVFSFIEGDSFALKMHIDKQKLFSLPVVKKMILAQSAEIIWSDLFGKNILLPERKGKSWGDYMDQLTGIPYSELVYNLFILNMRDKIFDGEVTVSLNYFRGSKMGIVEIFDLDERFKKEVVYVLQNGVVYRIIIRSKKNDPMAEKIRTRFLNILSYRETTFDSSVKIYADYKILPYHKRVKQEGMVYLYAGWSHRTGKEEFLREMIQFLERGGGSNLYYLAPLYKYAQKRFGTSLSSVSGNLEKYESAARKLKRKTQEELEKELKEARDDGSDVVDEDFANEKEKIKYHLQRVKDKNINTDNEDNVLER
jgi:hypothetical protein